MSYESDNQNTPSNRDAHMKYQIVYRLIHPEYLPATSITVVNACSHAELETQLVKIITKWQARGYNIRVTHVSQAKPRKSRALH